jgi:hypothetical protein
VTDDPTYQRWAYALGRGKVGQENADRLTEELNAAVAADFLKWQENEERLAQERPQVLEGIALSKDVTSFILDHLLPQLMDGQRSKDRPKTHKILDLVVALEPDQFVALVQLYAHRIGDRKGVSRALDILSAPSSFHRQHLKAYRDSYVGGRERAARAKAALRERDQKILKRRDELLAEGKTKHNIASILGKEFERTATRIRQILKNTKA